MCAFTDDEIAFLTKWGNENVANIWLHSYKKSSYPEPNPKDAQKLKEYMKAVYEQKRFYATEDESDDSESSDEEERKAKKHKKKLAGKKPKKEDEKTEEKTEVSFFIAHNSNYRKKNLRKK